MDNKLDEHLYNIDIECQKQFELLMKQFAEKENMTSIHISGYLNLGDDINEELLTRAELCSFSKNDKNISLISADDFIIF